VSRARQLRKESTPSERILWRHLRNRQLANYKFRRQHEIGRYILDFYCPDKRLSVELDGGGHNYLGNRCRDEKRTTFLANQGVIVLRFWNNQVQENVSDVLQAILFALDDAPSAWEVSASYARARPISR
jgi:very-short-patch-repair endonuclease